MQSKETTRTQVTEKERKKETEIARENGNTTGSKLGVIARYNSNGTDMMSNKAIAISRVLLLEKI